MAENRLQSRSGEYSFPDWNTLFNAIPHPTVVLNKEHTVIAANRKVVELLNKPFSEILSMKCWQIFHNPNLTYAPEGCRFEKMLSTNSIEITEMELEVFGGWYIVSCTPILNKAGQLDGVIHIAVDITDRKRLESQLEQKIKEYQSLSITLETIFDAIPDIIGIQELDHRIIRYNKAGYDYLQSSPETVNGKKCFKLIGRDKPCDVCATSEVYKTMKPSRKERYIPEIFRWIEIRAYPVMGKEGTLEKVIEHLRDITDRKRTEELLVNAQKLESLGVLAGGIAHDFNNLMSGIFVYIEMASRASTEAQVKQDLAEAMQTIDRARALTQQLLTFSKGGSPIQEVSPLFPFIQKTAQFALSGSNVLCRFDIADDLWPANFDKNQIGQVIDNLVINAQQAMPLGGTIVVSVRNVVLADGEHPLLEEGDYVRLSVTDTGIGIPQEIKKRIFDPFFTTKTKGHGLGLATCYSIVNRHGGCIDVESEPGKGSTFNVYLPAAREMAYSPNDVTAKEHKGSGTFLVMDDEEVIRKTVSSMLTSFGYTVVCTVNGQEAIDYVASAIRDNQTLSGMLFDLTVAGAMGGKAAIEQIRKMGVDIPAFVASGYADDPIIRNPAEYGFTASICKPFMGSEFAAMLEKYMKRKG